MRVSQFLYSGTVAVIFSLSVTAGSIYVTVTAASTQSAAVPEPQPDPVVSTEVLETQLSSALGIPDVRLTAEGWLTARISAIDIATGTLQPEAGVEVWLTAADGTRLTTLTDNSGFVAFENMGPGVYAIQASGPGGTLSFGIRAVPAELTEIIPQAVDSEDGLISMTVQLDAALAPGRDNSTVTAIRDSTTVDSAEGAVADPGQVAAAWGQLTAANADNTLDPRTYQEYDPRGVELTPEGSLEGQLALLNWHGEIIPVSDLTVSFISDGIVVGQTPVNPDGSFEQWNLLPGTYSLVVSGRDGFGCVGIDVIASTVAEDGDRYIPTAEGQPEPWEFCLIQGTGASGVVMAEEEFVTEECCDTCPMPGLAAAPAYGYGGGGGVPGGGGWGELLGAAAIGLGAAALLNDDDSPASPSN